MRRLSALLLFVCTAILRAQPEPVPTLRIPRVSRAPRLADFLNHTPREAELTVTDFRQFDPGDGVPVTRPTTAFLSYDERNLYVAFIAKDDPALIRSRVAKRKQILTDDRVTINIDTFHDHRHAYWFDVNPHAVQLDGITTDGYGDDFSWEGLWYTDARIVDDGYVVLITVPFRTLRFPNSAEQRWGVMLGRFIQRNNEFAMWPYITRRKLPTFVAQFGHLEGLHDISPGRNVQFIPYGLISGARFLERPAGAAPFLDTQATRRFGLDGKVVLKDALTWDFTLNPDFSQVESDEPQLVANQRYEVYYPERRPFFMENASYFRTPQRLFFTRRIVDPEFGSRLTGKIGRWGIGAIVADDRAPGKGRPEGDPLRDERALAGILSIQRDILKDSHVRLFATSRDFSSSYNRAVGLDTRLHLPHKFFLTAQGTTSVSRPLQGRDFSGNAYSVWLDRFDRKVQYQTTYTDISPGFRSDLGFIPRTDIRELKNTLGYKWWREKKGLINYGPSFTLLRNWNRAGQVQDWEIDASWNMEFVRLTTLKVTRSEAYELFQGHGFRKGANHAELSTEWWKSVALNASLSQGTSVNFYPAAGLAPHAADAVNASVGLTLRPGARLRLDETYLYDHLAAPGGASVYNNHIARSKVNYQLTRALSFRAILDYNGMLSNQAFSRLEPAKQMNYDFLFTWLVHPGTALHVGYTDLNENLRLDPSRPPYLYRSARPDFNTGRQLFVKASYLFRY